MGLYLFTALLHYSITGMVWTSRFWCHFCVFLIGVRFIVLVFLGFLSVLDDRLVCHVLCFTVLLVSGRFICLSSISDSVSSIALNCML